MVEGTRSARSWLSPLVSADLVRTFRWLPVLLAASFPVAVFAALARGTANAGNVEAISSLPVEAGVPGEIDLSISEAFTPEVRAWAPDILRWAVQYELPPELVATVMQIESCGHPSVHSSAGAAGLFQVMPFHFGADEDPLDPETNAFRGLSYLARSLDLAEGNTALALAGYNGGHGQIGRAASSWPSETQRYVRWGAAILADIEGGVVPSPGLTSWLQAGGESLCRRAAQALESS